MILNMILNIIIKILGPIKRITKKFENNSIISNLRRYKLHLSSPFYPFIKLANPILRSVSNRMPNFINSAIYSGNRVLCLCCGWKGQKFLSYNRRINARCPNCGSLERDRMIYAFLKIRHNFFRSKFKVLDIGPSNLFQDQLSSLNNLEYISIDLINARAMMQMDITQMNFPSQSFDIIICSNVLEHVKNDIMAISEIFRVLKIKGFALILVPIGGDQTLEDPTITPDQYEKYYGCSHHVRLYGLDIQNKLKDAGFKVKLEFFGQKFSNSLNKKYGFDKNEIFFICLK